MQNVRGGDDLDPEKVGQPGSGPGVGGGVKGSGSNLECLNGGHGGTNRAPRKVVAGPSQGSIEIIKKKKGRVRGEKKKSI